MMLLQQLDLPFPPIVECCTGECQDFEQRPEDVTDSSSVEDDGFKKNPSPVMGGQKTTSVEYNASLLPVKSTNMS